MAKWSGLLASPTNDVLHDFFVWRPKAKLHLNQA